MPLEGFEPSNLRSLAGSIFRSGTGADTPGEIRILTYPVLSRMPLPIGLREHKRRWRDLNPHAGFPACLLSRQIPSPVWVHLRKTPTPGLEPGHPLKDYSRFSKPLPYQLGLCRHERRRQDLNLHGLSACLFSRQGLHHLSDCGKTSPAGFEPAHPFG